MPQQFANAFDSKLGVHTHGRDMLIAFSDKSNGLSFVRNKNGHRAMRRASMAYTKTCDIAK